MEKSNTELLSLAKAYFDHNDELQEIHASVDGHFFYQEGHVIQYCKGEIKRIRITREDVLNIGKKKTNKELLQDKAEELKIEGWEGLSAKDLKTKIDEVVLAAEKRKLLVDEAIVLNLEGYEDMTDEDLEELIDKTKVEAKDAIENKEKHDALLLEAIELELEDYEELSIEELETKVNEAKTEIEDRKLKMARKEELEAIGDDRTEIEDEELEKLVEELGETS